MNTIQSNSSRRSTVLVYLIVVACLGVMVVRGLLHPPRLFDFRTVYAASRVWADRGNPYDHDALERAWLASGGADVVNAGPVGDFPSVYPPTTFLVIAPLAMLPARAACAVWVAIMLTGLGAAIWQLADMAGLHGTCAEVRDSQPSPGTLAADARTRAAWLFAAIVFLLGPLHIALQAGQLVVICFSYVVLAMAARRKNRPYLACVLMTIAVCLKPQLALPFVLFDLLRRPRFASATLSLCGVIALIAVWQLQHSGTDWLGSLRSTYAIANAPAGSFDYTSNNPIRDHLINLQHPMFAVFQNHVIANAATFTVVLILAIVFLAKAVRLPKGADELLAVSVVAALALLPVYHRYYDAIFLAIPIAWAMRHRNSGRGWWVVAVVPFFLPVAWAGNLRNRGFVSEAFASGHFWNVIVMPLYGWLVLAWCVMLVVWFWRTPATVESEGTLRFQ